MIKNLRNHYQHKWQRVLRNVYLCAYVVIGGYISFEIIAAGLFPALYAAIYIVTFVLIGALAAFLLFRPFNHAVWLARTAAVVISLVFLLASGAGLYVLKSGLSTLDNITTDANSVNVETSRAFNVYISGIDTYGDISTQSRSDVNIVATVNPDKRTILLTTIPRDSYVRIAGGGNNEYDKLTHAGNYGVEASMQTVANLLEIPVTAYVRINFTSFIESIDKLGGVTLNNPVAFSIEGENFPVGNINLDGRKALLYSRERKSLEGGDVDRGKNQQRVIQAIVNKISGIRSIDGFNALLDSIGGSVQTNFSTNSIKSLVASQLASPGGWTTTSQVVGGKGQTGGLTSYAMPAHQLYMYVLNEDSLKDVKAKITEAAQQ